MSKRQMTMEQSFAVKSWIESHSVFAKAADSISQVSIKASEDLGWPVSPSSIRSVMAALKMERDKPQKKAMTIAEGLDRAEFDRLKSDFAWVLAYLAGNFLASGQQAAHDRLMEVAGRNK